MTREPTTKMALLWYHSNCPARKALPMSLGYVKRAIAHAWNPRFFFDPASGRIAGTNGHRMHVYEVEPVIDTATAVPFALEEVTPNLLDLIDFDEEQGWDTPQYYAKKRGESAIHPVKAERGYNVGRIFSMLDHWLEQPVVWRKTTVEMLRDALASAKTGETWVLDASTPDLLVFRYKDSDGEEVEEEKAFDITLEPGEVPAEAQQYGISGKYLRDAIMGPGSQVIYLGWNAQAMKDPLIVGLEDKPVYAAIMGMRI